jgi:acetyltransferase-like isoleucine patch superfamily enzyme
MKIILSIYKQYKICCSTNSNFLVWSILRVYYLVFYRKTINSHHKVTIKGLKNISINKSLRIGMNPEGFVPRDEETYLNILGEMTIKGSWSVGRGCKIWVDPNGTLEIGNGGYVNSYTNFMVGHSVKIGDNCIISWNCQFLNEGKHQIAYNGRQTKGRNILIGNNVWIGNNVKIYEGAIIPDNCVVASDSVIKSAYYKKNVLIGGNPSKILKEEVTWTV